MKKGTFMDLSGNIYGRLMAVSLIGRIKRRTFWLCKCQCGKVLKVESNNLKSGNTQSCGCYKDEVRFIHGHDKHRKPGGRSKTYCTWYAMIGRCQNHNHERYKNYGGRGITVCARWRNSFVEFLSDMGERPDGMTIHRIDNDGNYEPGNCKWATPAEQAENKRRPRKLTEEAKYAVHA